MNSPLTATEAIQAILAPAVTISSSALFFLGLSNRYVALITRIRLLNDEKRQLHREFLAQPLTEDNQERLTSIDHQIPLLVKMAWLVRIAILFHILAVASFVLASFCIGLNFFIGTQPIFQQAALYLFILGLLGVFCGAVSTGLDILISYPVVLLEVHEIDKRRRVYPSLFR